MEKLDTRKYWLRYRCRSCGETFEREHEVTYVHQASALASQMLEQDWIVHDCFLVDEARPLRFPENAGRVGVADLIACRPDEVE